MKRMRPPQPAEPPSLGKIIAKEFSEAIKPLTNALTIRPLVEAFNASTMMGSSASSASSAAVLDVANAEKMIVFPARQAELLSDTLQRGAFSAKQASELCMKLCKQFSYEAHVLETAHDIVKHMVWEAKHK